MSLPTQPISTTATQALALQEAPGLPPSPPTPEPELASTLPGYVITASACLCENLAYFSALGLHHVAEGRGVGDGSCISALHTVKEVTTLSDGRKEKFLRGLTK